VNRISGIMVSLLASSAVDLWFLVVYASENRLRYLSLCARRWLFWWLSNLFPKRYRKRTIYF